MGLGLFLFAGSVAGGAIAAISGFGIGSVLTPVFSTFVDTKLAVAAVSIPHVIGTFIRFLRLRKHIDRSLALSFGAASAAGGILGAVLNAYANAPVLRNVFAGLLVFAGLSGVTGVAERIKLHGVWKWLGGFASAAFGGLVGNQGGIRSAAMLGFDLEKQSFVATATAIALVVDAARMPVYLLDQHERLFSIFPMLLVSIAGVIIGTIAGSHLLNRIPERSFKRLVSVVVLVLGIFMFFHTDS
jgi:uncharacterized membrane protein YfcA